MKEIKAFQCDFCKKYYKHKSSAKRHEDICYRNPDNRACLTCGNFEQYYETVYVRPHGDQNYGDADYEEQFLICKATEKDFGAEKIIDRQKFQHHCRMWKPIEFEEDEIAEESISG